MIWDRSFIGASPPSKRLCINSPIENRCFYNTTLCANIGHVKMETSHTILHCFPLLQFLQDGMHINQFYLHVHGSHPCSQAHLHHTDE